MGYDSIADVHRYFKIFIGYTKFCSKTYFFHNNMLSV